MKLFTIVLPAMVLLTGCAAKPDHEQVSSQSPVNTVAAKGQPPQAFLDAAEYAENIYDLAKASDWRGASAKLTALQIVVRKLPPPANQELENNAETLEKAILAKKQILAQSEANQITLRMAELQTRYSLEVPVEIAKLDYYGRELEVRTMRSGEQDLATVASGLRRTWDAVRPEVERRDPPEALRFEGLVAKVEASKARRDQRRLAVLILDEVDKLENVFHAGH